MSRKKEKQPEPFIYEYVHKYFKEERKQREIKPLLNQPSNMFWKKKVLGDNYGRRKSVCRRRTTKRQ